MSIVLLSKCERSALQLISSSNTFLALTDEEEEEEESPPISEADWQMGFQAGRMAVLLGSTEAALFMTEILGKAAYFLTLPYLALASDECIHAAAFLRAVTTERQKPAPGIADGTNLQYVTHFRLFEEEGAYIDLPWKGKPFCRAPNPGLLFYKSGKRTLDVVELTLRRVRASPFLDDSCIM